MGRRIRKRRVQGVYKIAQFMFEIGVIFHQFLTPERRRIYIGQIISENY